MTVCGPARVMRAAGAAGSALLLLVGCGSADSSRGLAVGDTLPRLVVTGLDGTSVTLDAFRGKVTVLNVWAVWCAPCRLELPDLDRLSRRLDPARFQVLGVSIDEDRYLLQEFLRDHSLGFSVMQDPHRRAARRLGVAELPDTLLIAPDGTLAARVTGAREWDTPEAVKLLQRLYEERRLARRHVASALPRRAPPGPGGGRR